MGFALLGRQGPPEAVSGVFRCRHGAVLTLWPPAPRQTRGGGGVGGGGGGGGGGARGTPPSRPPLGRSRTAQESPDAAKPRQTPPPPTSLPWGCYVVEKFRTKADFRYSCPDPLLLSSLFFLPPLFFPPPQRFPGVSGGLRRCTNASGVSLMPPEAQRCDVVPPPTLEPNCECNGRKPRAKAACSSPLWSRRCKRSLHHAGSWGFCRGDSLTMWVCTNKRDCAIY